MRFNPNVIGFVMGVTGVAATAPVSVVGAQCPGASESSVSSSVSRVEPVDARTLCLIEKICMKKTGAVSGGITSEEYEDFVHTASDALDDCLSRSRGAGEPVGAATTMVGSGVSVMAKLSLVRSRFNDWKKGRARKKADKLNEFEFQKDLAEAIEFAQTNPLTVNVCSYSRETRNLAETQIERLIREKSREEQIAIIHKSRILSLAGYSDFKCILPDRFDNCRESSDEVRKNLALRRVCAARECIRLVGDDGGAVTLTDEDVIAHAGAIAVRAGDDNACANEIEPRELQFLLGKDAAEKIVKGRKPMTRATDRRGAGAGTAAARSGRLDSRSREQMKNNAAGVVGMVSAAGASTLSTDIARFFSS